MLGFEPKRINIYLLSIAASMLNQPK